MPNKKILVADDDPGIVDAMQILLEDEGYKVITTLDGTAITKMYEQKPDLVFLDIWMSGVNGNTICKELKANDDTKSIPIIMFSANRDTQEIAMACGADDFLSKPFDIKDLMDIVKKHIDK
jgi:DNA-binding response OmpR family regulator